MTMKKVFRINVILAIFLCLSLFAFPQEGTFSFNYDAGGNLIERKVMVLPQFRMALNNTRSDSAKKEEPVPFKVFPNPTYEYLNIEGNLPDDFEKAELSLLTINGQKIQQDEYLGAKKSIFVGNLANGVYFLEVKYSKDGISRFKIIVNH